MKTTRENKQLEFLQKNMTTILNTALENKTKIGYVNLYADNNFNLVTNSLRFKECDFDKESFTSITFPNVPQPTAVIEAEFIYYSVLWFDNKTKWQVRELKLIHEYHYS